MGENCNKRSVRNSDESTPQDSILTPRDELSALDIERLVREERFAAVRDLANGAAHHFNNMLTASLGGVSFLLTEETVRQLPEDLLDLLRRLSGDLERMAEYTSSLAEVTEISRERADFSSLPIAPVIGDVAKQADERASSENNGTEAERKILMRMESSRSVWGDPKLLRRTFEALLINAREAVGKDGEIQLSSWDEGDEILVEVKDNGNGMDANTRKRCIEPFFSTKGLVGVGLGMSVVQLGAQTHGAILEVDSAPNRGTRVLLRFPAASRSGPPLERSP